MISSDQVYRIAYNNGFANGKEAGVIEAAIAASLCGLFWRLRELVASQQVTIVQIQPRPPGPVNVPVLSSWNIGVDGRITRAQSVPL